MQELGADDSNRCFAIPSGRGNDVNVPVVTKNVIRRQGSCGMPKGYPFFVRAAYRPSRRRLIYRRSWHRVLCGLRLGDDLMLCSAFLS
jgi:hypothetical protein